MVPLSSVVEVSKVNEDSATSSWSLLVAVTISEVSVVDTGEWSNAETHSGEATGEEEVGEVEGEPGSAASESWVSDTELSTDNVG